MSGDSHHYGDSAWVNGGSGNTGIDKRQIVVNNDVGRLTEELVRMMRELRAEVAPEAPATAQVIDDALPVIASDAGAPRERHRALIAVATIAATVGAVGQPVADAANKLLTLLGG